MGKVVEWVASLKEAVLPQTTCSTLKGGPSFHSAYPCLYNRDAGMALVSTLAKAKTFGTTVPLPNVV